MKLHPWNEAALASRPALRAALYSALDAPPTWTLQRARNGSPVPVRAADGRWLFSRYDPRREIERWLDQQALAPDDLPVFVGFHPELAAVLAARPIIFVEKDAALLACLLAEVPLVPGATDPPASPEPGTNAAEPVQGISLVLDPDGFAMMSAVRNAYDTFRHRRVRLLPLPHVEDTAWVKSILEHGVRIQREIGLNAISYSVQLPKWIAAARANLAAMMEGPDGRALYDGLRGRTAVVVGAGPSLDRNIDRLAACRGRLLVIAVDTALRRLERAGIVPDIAVAVDANDANARDVDGLGPELLEHTILAADPISSPAIVRAFRGPRTFLRSINFTFDLEGRAVPMVEPLDVLLHEIAGRRVIAAWQSGGSVSTNAFNLCHLLGISRVILVGQDLAFTGDRAHSSGVGHEDDLAAGALGRFRTREMYGRLATKDGEYAVPAWNGGVVRTNEVLREYLNWFEMTMTHGFGRVFREVIDATEGGAAKKGMKRMTLEDAIAHALADEPAGDPGAALKSRLAAVEPAGMPGWQDRVVAYVDGLRAIAKKDPGEIARAVPLAPWIVLPAWLGSGDLGEEERLAVQRGGILSAVDFLIKVFGGLADEFRAASASRTASLAAAASSPAASSPASSSPASSGERPGQGKKSASRHRAGVGQGEGSSVAGLHVAAARDGAPALAIASASGIRFLDDAASPSQAARDRVASASARGARLLVLLGLGLGHDLEAAVARNEFEAVVVVDADPRARARALSSRADAASLQRALSDPRVVDLTGLGPEEVFRRLAARFDQGMEDGRHLVVLPRLTRLVHPSADLDPHARAAFEERLDALTVLSERNRTTLGRFAEPWRRQILANLPSILEGGRVADLVSAAKGVPAVLLGAGPSLDRALGPLGEALRDADAAGVARPLLVVVDTALRAVSRAGLTPDLVVAVDATEENRTDFDGVTIDAERTALVYVPVVHPAIPPLFPRRYAASYGHPLQVWLEEATGRPFGSLSISGSVATLAYDLLRLLGCRPVILAGLDLAVAASSHTRGTLTGRGESRFGTVETRMWRHARTATLRRTGWGGGTAHTTEQMMRWIEWFEGELVRRPWPTINATGGGVRIEGTREMAIGEAVRRHPAKAWRLPEPRPYAGKGIERVRRSLAAIVDGVPEAERLVDLILRWDLCTSDPARAPRIREEFRDQVRAIRETVEAPGPRPVTDNLLTTETTETTD